MLLGHQTLIDQYSISNHISAMLSCLINDISAKLGLITYQSIPGTGRKGAGFGTVEGMLNGRAVSTFADARSLRAKGRIVRQLYQLCAGVFSTSMNLRKHPEQRAGRWRAAKSPLRDGLSNAKEQYYGTDPNDRDSDDDGVMDSAEVFWNVDTDGDGKINSLDPDSDNDGLTDGTELGVTVPVPGTSTIGGTNVSAYMDDGECLRKCFTPDADPTTTTNVTIPDTDGDGFYDGWVDDGDGVYEEGYSEYLGEDLNYDGNRDSTEMDPNDRDTDDDGVADNYTFMGKQCQGHLDTDNDGIINALEYDSDNDGLADAIEMGFTFVDISFDTNRAKDIFFPDQNPKYKTDPLNPDTDDDGLLDGIEDADHNGALDGDLDGDNFWDPEETWFETNPLRNDTDRDGLYDGDNGSLGAGEYAEDKDNDGTVDDDETDPVRMDSDGDNLDDGEEMIAGEDGYISDPTKRDTDGDNLTDGQEFEGWPTIAIYFGDTKERIGEPWNVSSNPNKVDTDGDGLTDFEEFNNGSDPNKNDTDGDGLTDYEELCFWEAFPIFAQMYGLDPETMDLENPSSPIHFDKQPPFIENVKISIYKTKDDKYYVEISGLVIDIFGIDWLYVRMETRDAKQVNLYGEQIKTFKTSFKANYNRLLWDGYDLWVKACDVNGNEAKYKTHQDGVVEGIVNAVMKLLSQIASVISELLSAFLDFIWGMMEGMMNTVLKPIVDAINNFNKELREIIRQIGEECNTYKDFSTQKATKIVSFLFNNNIFYGFLAIGITIMAIEIIIKIITSGAAALLDCIIPFLGAIIIAAIFYLVEFSSDEKFFSVSKLFNSFNFDMSSDDETQSNNEDTESSGTTISLFDWRTFFLILTVLAGIGDIILAIVFYTQIIDVMKSDVAKAFILAAFSIILCLIIFSIQNVNNPTVDFFEAFIVLKLLLLAALCNILAAKDLIKNLAKIAFGWTYAISVICYSIGLYSLIITAKDVNLWLRKHWDEINVSLLKYLGLEKGKSTK